MTGNKMCIEPTVQQTSLPKTKLFAFGQQNTVHNLPENDDFHCWNYTAVVKLGLATQSVKLSATANQLLQNHTHKRDTRWIHYGGGGRERGEGGGRGGMPHWLTVLVAQCHDAVHVIGIVHHKCWEIFHIHPNVRSLLHLYKSAKWNSLSK